MCRCVWSGTELEWGIQCSMWVCVLILCINLHLYLSICASNLHPNVKLTISSATAGCKSRSGAHFFFFPITLKDVHKCVMRHNRMNSFWNKINLLIQFIFPFPTLSPPFPIITYVFSHTVCLSHSFLSPRLRLSLSACFTVIKSTRLHSFVFFFLTIPRFSLQPHCACSLFPYQCVGLSSWEMR